MIDCVNTKPNYSLKPITKFPLDTSQLNTNSWLAGFAEGDASFQIRTTEGRYRHVATSFELCQVEMIQHYFKLINQLWKQQLPFYLLI